MSEMPTIERKRLGQIVLVLQGGGALGAYQLGVYQALCESGIEPDWVIGTSIGAINASLIAGNAPEWRLQRLQEFWRRVTHPPLSQLTGMTPLVGQWAANMAIISGGLSNFFRPNPLALLGLLPLGSERCGYYSTEPLERTLEDLVDPIRLNAGKPRLTVGAAKVQTGEMHYFDSRECELTIRHVMASGALPPAFRPCRSMVISTGTAAFFPTRRSRLCSTTCRDATVSYSRSICGRPMGPNRTPSGKCSPARRICSMRAGLPATSPGTSRSTSCVTSFASLRQSSRQMWPRRLKLRSLRP
jgi:Patatin-like phospholipase